MKLEGRSSETPPKGPGREEKLIPGEPHLRDIEKVLTLLESEKTPEGDKFNWKDVYKSVEPGGSMGELTENARGAVRRYVAEKIPELKKRIPSVEDLGDEELLDALTNNWFEEIGEVGGQRREVLLSVAAHVVKRIETFVIRKVLEEADEVIAQTKSYLTIEGKQPERI
jgi:predicted house-cleaning noncanonical NTP pyrophosphatase (MazG superfamily)